MRPTNVVRLFRNLGCGALPASLEAVAVAVHLQDVDVVGEPVQQRAGEALAVWALRYPDGWPNATTGKQKTPGFAPNQTLRSYLLTLATGNIGHL